MLKKYILLLSLSVLLLSANNHIINKKEASEIAKAVFSMNKDVSEKYKKQLGELHLWLLNRDLWKKSHRDEFVFDDVKLQYYDKLMKESDSIKNKYLGKEITFTRNVVFGKYNFETESFPINFRADNNKIIPYGGDGKYFYKVLLDMKDINYKNLTLNMKKSKAKKFINSRKNRKDGAINRKLKAVVSGKIEDINRCNWIGYKSIKYIKPDFKNVGPREAAGIVCIKLDVKSISYTDR